MSKDDQHFVPQFYLRGFTIDGEKSLIWEFDKKESKFNRVPKSVRQICCKLHYYAQYDEKNKLHIDLLEDGFNKFVETFASTTVKSIQPKDTRNSIYLSPMDQAILCYFVSTQYTRVPEFRDRVENSLKSDVKNEFNKLFAYQQSKGILPEIIEKTLNASEIEVEVHSWVSIKPMLEQACKGSTNLLKKTPVFFLPADGMSFITSDNPVSFYIRNWKNFDNHNDLGPFHDQAEVFLPLRSDLALVYFPIQNAFWDQPVELQVRYMKLDPDRTRLINKHTATFATRYLYLSKKNRSLFE